jgi:AcrR family transcriptional regulator
MARTYLMRARAESAEVTRRKILGAATALLGERPAAEVRLQQIAGRAEVSVQTILRVYGTRAALLEQATGEGLRTLTPQRTEPRPGDVPATVASLFDGYEALGDLAGPPARAWVEGQFAPQLARHPGARRARVLNALQVACALHTWRLLRRDQGLGREEAEATVRRLVTGVLGG